MNHAPCCNVLIIKHLPELLLVNVSAGTNQEQQLARERSLECAQAELQRRYHISDEAHPQQAGSDASVATDQVIFDFSLSLFGCVV